jgi:hypothetical protein
MIFVRYDRTRLILAALAMLGLAYGFSAGVGASADLGIDTLASLMFVIMVCAGSRLGYLASGDLAALKEDAGGLVVNGLWFPRRIAWRNFGGIAIRGVRIMWLPVPFLSFNHVMVRDADAGLIGHPKFPMLLTDVPSGRLAAISAQLDTLALERGRSVPQEAGATTGGSFDPDDAIARYLARKQEAEPEAVPQAASPSRPMAAPRAPVAARAGFGRKGL